MKAQQYEMGFTVHLAAVKATPKVQFTLPDPQLEVARFIAWLAGAYMRSHGESVTLFGGLVQDVLPITLARFIK